MDIRAIIMGLAFALMWSSAFSSARIIVADASPLFSLALRFLISGLLGVAIARLMGQSWRLTRPQLFATVLFGVCQNALYLGLNFYAMQTVEASVAAIIASTMPLLVALASWLFLGEKLKPLGVLGLFAGMLGVAIIMGARISQGIDLFGIALCGLGALALAFATLAVRGATSGGNFMMIVGLQMLVGSGILFIAAPVFETIHINPTMPFLLAFAYTTLVPGLAATLIWFLLLDRIGPIRAATFHFLNPVFGVGVAAALLGESLGVLDGIGVLVTTVGILAVQLSRQPAPKST
ncbi:EamA/RhaT family transporter [Phaeobacter gallaeciensis]|uniref:EamA/RhaT family transporter n=2 Tax=Roseobacteraceae TaxID=2854170 RepID=A0A366WUS2_9RHOB|nr:MULTISPECIES: DMT family transporter [Roseobacteraceae]MBT3142148.1 DMT family transporter [Falsiruegeria litorea]MBT8168507.1 DMT family transporter [Falsiruegeria litorea]RBW54008.1 EamA/RhaT family transporter [Phaeobacter gallaeciensis]